MAAAWRYEANRTKDNPFLPVKTIKLNRCPVIAPLGVLSADQAAQQRIGINLAEIDQYFELIKNNAQHFATELIKAVGILNDEQDRRRSSTDTNVDNQLYAGFYSDEDKRRLINLHQNENPAKIRQIRTQLSDSRLKSLSSLYLARNYKDQLTQDELKGWENYLTKSLMEGGLNGRLAVYLQQVAQLKQTCPDRHSQVLLEDLELYGQSLIPTDRVEEEPTLKS